VAACVIGTFPCFRTLPNPLSSLRLFIVLDCFEFLRPGGEKEENVTMTVKLFIGNLSFKATEENLEELFSQAGQVVSTRVVTDRETGRPRGFGFVEMSSKEEADKAIQMFNNFNMNGRAIAVNEARPRENSGGGGSRGGGGGGGYRDRDSSY